MNKPTLTYRELIYLTRVISGELNTGFEREELHELRNKLQTLVLVAWNDELKEEVERGE